MDFDPDFDPDFSNKHPDQIVTLDCCNLVFAITVAASGQVFGSVAVALDAEGNRHFYLNFGAIADTIAGFVVLSNYCFKASSLDSCFADN